MAEMAIGYGSEFQLLRYLGHHRKYLNEQILKVLKVKDEIEWFDYPVNPERDSMDGEFKGIECFKDMKNYIDIKTEWKNYWPQTGNSQNWDGIFKIGNKFFFVEAKAHVDESHQKCGAGEKSKEIIKKAFAETCGNVDVAAEWLSSNCYQLANRLAFLNFCNKFGIKAELVYICFYNGYRVNPKKDLSPKDKKWEVTMENNFETLKLTEKLKEKIHVVYIDCLEG